MRVFKSRSQFVKLYNIFRCYASICCPFTEENIFLGTQYSELIFNTVQSILPFITKTIYFDETTHSFFTRTKIRTNLSAGCNNMLHQLHHAL